MGIHQASVVSPLKGPVMRKCDIDSDNKDTCMAGAWSDIGHINLLSPARYGGNFKMRNFATCSDSYFELSSEIVPGKYDMHYNEVIMSVMVSQITSLTIVYSSVYSGTNERKHQSSASLAFVRGIHRGPVNSPHKGTVTRKMFPFDDVIMDFTDDESMLVQVLIQCRQATSHYLNRSWPRLLSPYVSIWRYFGSMS